jgi:hypothetical protein
LAAANDARLALLPLLGAQSKRDNCAIDLSPHVCQSKVGFRDQNINGALPRFVEQFGGTPKYFRTIVRGQRRLLRIFRRRDRCVDLCLGCLSNLGDNSPAKFLQDGKWALARKPRAVNKGSCRKF